jgi:hypothetical protein
MRWLRDIVFLIVLIAVGSGAVWYQSQLREEQARLDKTTADTQRLEREVHYRAATKMGQLNARGWPVTVDPDWFLFDPPQNLVVSQDRPWVEIASEEEAGLLHPPVRMTLDDQAAAFWYNPYQGVVRARVPVAMTDDAATAMYNAINRASISSIHWAETPMDIPKPKQDKPAIEGESAQESPPERKTAAAPPEREQRVVVVKRPPAASKKPRSRFPRDGFGSCRSHPGAFVERLRDRCDSIIACARMPDQIVLNERRADCTSWCDRT